MTQKQSAVDKKELWQKIRKNEKLYERRKLSRAISVILLYSAVCLRIIYAQGKLDTTSLLHIIGEIGGCIFIGGIAFYVNSLIFCYMFTRSDSENKRIEYLKQQLKEMEQKENRLSQSDMR